MCLDSVCFSLIKYQSIGTVSRSKLQRREVLEKNGEKGVNKHLPHHKESAGVVMPMAVAGGGFLNLPAPFTYSSNQLKQSTIYSSMRLKIVFQVITRWHPFVHTSSGNEL